MKYPEEFERATGTVEVTVVCQDCGHTYRKPSQVDDTTCPACASNGTSPATAVSDDR